MCKENACPAGNMKLDSCHYFNFKAARRFLGLRMTMLKEQYVLHIIGISSVKLPINKTVRSIHLYLSQPLHLKPLKKVPYLLLQFLY